ncbi:MAG: hypothetical protein JO115_13420 [Pseudonocardiales bacterium]|nr:hypothetical protein [Pseudonocardiales bacterium]
MTIFGAASPWMWFVIAGLAAAAGSALLAVDRRQHSAHQRERRRWAMLRGWRFVLSDPVLAQRWRHGVLAPGPAGAGGAGLATAIVTGSLFTAVGRRAVQVFDLEQGGQLTCVVVAVQRRALDADVVADAELVAELWWPGRPLPQDADLAMLGPVGERIALVNDPELAAALSAPEFVFAVGALGEDIPVAWVEQDWVLAAAPGTATPARLERLLRALDEVADLLESADSDHRGRYSRRVRH